MADESSSAGPSSSYSTTESLESTVEVNVKTLDSQIYTFRVNKNVPVSSFKEKIASAVNVPVGQQRLIFRGKVLKDDHLLSEYHLEDGHTLHLVARQPSQSETPAGTSSGEAGGNHENRGSTSSKIWFCMLRELWGGGGVVAWGMAALAATAGVVP